MVQGCSQAAAGAMAAYQDPHVREAVASGVTAAAQRAEPLVKACAGATAAARDCAEQSPLQELATTFGVIFDGIPSCVPRPCARLEGGTYEGSRPVEAECSSIGQYLQEAVQIQLPSGTQVKIFGLQCSTDLNGRL